jgi:molybdate transport system substrate-binding protein
MTIKRRMRVLAPLVAVGLLVAGCGSSSSSSSSTTAQASNSSTTNGSASPVTLNVSAAASLTAAFQTLGDQFHAANPNVKVVFNFAGSNTLATQITQGAPFNVFASADTQTMDKVTADVNAPVTFAHNQVAVIIPASNPAHIATLKDLANPGVKIAVADPSVPVGNYTLEVLNNMAASPEYGPSYEAAVKKNFVTQETSVSGVSTKVQTAEVDAGYVYVTGGLAAGAKVKILNIPAQFNVKAVYPIATNKSGSNASTAQSFVDYVLSDPGQATLAKYGFLPAK